MKLSWRENDIWKKFDDWKSEEEWDTDEQHGTKERKGKVKWIREKNRWEENVLSFLVWCYILFIDLFLYKWEGAFQFSLHIQVYIPNKSSRILPSHAGS
jgi:hypothetical protein